MNHIKKLWVWIPTALLLFIIFNFSSADGVKSAGMSSRLTVKLVNSFTAIPFLDFNPVQEKISVSMLHYLVRKAGHLTEYGALALTLAFALYKYHIGSSRLVFWSLAFGFFYACTDELHQLFVAGRSGRFTDVLIDSLGMSVGIVLFYLFIFFCHGFKFQQDGKRDNGI